ncbi:MAG: putative glycoside hydrolase [Acutalibacteraceae bacterium]
MNIKKLFEKQKNVYRTDKPRVRKSYYTFSHQYPAGNIPIERKTHLKLKSKAAKVNLFLLILLGVFLSSFFLVRLGLDISYKAPTVSGNSLNTSPTAVSSGDVSEAESVFSAGNFKALYMPGEHLGDKSYIKSFIKKIVRKDCNSVVIDFKTADGKLNYSSFNSYAIMGRCAVFDNNTVREAMALFKKENITVVARLYCFLDGTIPISAPELSVKYMDTEVNWIDSTSGENKMWLNPCNKQSLYYLLDIIKELNSFGVDGFLLEKCHYPDAGNVEGATYPGEKAFKSRNNAVRLFLDRVKKELPSDSFVILAQSATDSFNKNEDIYYGSISNFAIDGIAAHTIDRPPDVFLDKKTDFSAMVNYLTAIKNNYEQTSFIPIISFEEYSRKYMKTLKGTGFESYIIFDETGEY